MREKLLWISIAVVSALLATSRAQSPTQAPATARFQLFAAEQISVSLTGKQGSEEKRPVIMRLDTQTGQTWTYHEGNQTTVTESGPGVQMYTCWQKVDESRIMH
jgi:hypothetical protein